MTTNIELAKRIAQHVELDSIVLRRAHVEADFDPQRIPDEIGLSQQYRCEYDVSEQHTTGRISVTVDFKFYAKKIEDGQELGNVVALDAAFLLIYSAPIALDVEERCFKHFSEVNGPYNAWPYWRELVQTATGRVGLSGLTVPVYRPVASEVDKEEECFPSASGISERVTNDD